MDMLKSYIDKGLANAANKNFSTPLYDESQRNSIKALQSLLGSQATEAMQSLGGYARGEGFDAQNAELIRDYKENFAPSLMQGAAKNNLMGSSGVVGALETGAGRLRSMLSAQQEGRKWDATQSLLDLMGSFGTKRTSDISRSDAPSGLEVLLKALQTGGESEEQGWGAFLSPEVLGGIGTGVGTGIGGPAGGAVLGAVGSVLGHWIQSSRKG